MVLSPSIIEYILYEAMVLLKEDTSSIFSSGEEDIETWMDQASHALEEWDISEVLKKQRISKSLRGPAAEVICNLKLGKQNNVALY